MRLISDICIRLTAVFVTVVVVSWAGASEPASDLEPAIDFNRDIRSLLFGKCVTCHGPDEDERAADLRLDVSEGAIQDLGGYSAIVPGDDEASELISRITSDDEDVMMPPPGKGSPLTATEIELMREWIRQGAKYAEHWSYQRPNRPALPNVERYDWPSTPIDFFTLAKMEAAGKHPSREASRVALARRLALDLTGLPPTWEQAKAFVDDQRRDAYEIYVDSLLSHPAFGERWARVWLDLARYADSAGYADDPPRTIWAYRDYVIQSLNDNVPFDQFTLEQIAGDLLPSPTERQLIATAFHRNTLTNNEGGTNDEEFRNVAVVDRVNTTMAVWMGTTMACAQCHTHKYDPITQEEYFKFFAFFNSTVDADKRDESPRLDLWSEEQKRTKSNLLKKVEELEGQLNQTTEAVAAEQSAWLAQWDDPLQWQDVHPVSMSADRNLILGENGWVHATGDSRETDDYLLTFPVAGKAITGIRLQTSAEQNRNFVVSQIRASWKPDSDRVSMGRYIRVELEGESRFLHLAEIQAFSNGENVATLGMATQSSTYRNAIAGRVNDGNTDGIYEKGSVQHTQGEQNPWVEIDLGKNRPIDSIVLWNRTDGGESIINRFEGFTVSLLNEKRNPVWSKESTSPAKEKHVESVSGERTVMFSSARTDHEQVGFPAKSVITEQIDQDTGWAVAPQIGRPHELVLTLKTPLSAQPGKLELTIVQNSKHLHHLVDHFRVSFSSDDRLEQWGKLPSRIRGIVIKLRSDWSDSDSQAFDDYFRNLSKTLRPLREQVTETRESLAKLKPVTSVPVMREMPAEKRRETKVQIRGNYQNTGQSVSEGTPAVFHPIANAERPNRLDLANWLVDPQNPLTARVIVNRHWEQLFGIGIVSTSEEFGSQGELPSHPQLLDYLAVDFVEYGWDVKQLIKSMVMSSTYRQSSVTSAEAVAEDPDNRLLTRGPRFRISAEMVRDQALFVSGLLSEKQYGPPVNPPQPSLGLKAAFGSATDWKTSQGEDKYRRGIYTTWRRSSPYPSMAQFDAPNREVCTVRRIRTNTPLQALVTLNDPVYIEAAQAFARRLIAESDVDEKRIERAFEIALIRNPTRAESDRVLRLLRQATSDYEQRANAALKMATDPIGALPEGADACQHAAWTVVANVILNLDEMLMKR